MDIKIYDTLPEEAVRIREAVFVEEQGFQDEFDEIDSYAKHLVLFDGEKSIAVCRFFRDKETGDFTVGRIAVLKEYRGQNIGTKVLKAAEEAIKNEKGSKICLHAQLQAKDFYGEQGYLQYGDTDYEEFCPHIWMCKKLESCDSITA